VTLKCRENPPQEPFSRLATVRQLVIFPLALALGAAAALGLASCGGGEDAKLLPGNTAAEITENLDQVKQYAEEGECVGAEDAVSEVNTQVEGLAGVDPKLVEALERGATRLSEVVAGCQEEDSEAVPPEDEVTTTEETEKTPPGQEKKEEKEREKEEKALEKEEEKAEKEEEPPAEKTPEEPSTTPPPPSKGGGTGAPGGVSPSTPVTPEEGDE
jgi:outer membrane biosynthesis protein TonB